MNLLLGADESAVAEACDLDSGTRSGVGRGLGGFALLDFCVVSTG